MDATATDPKPSMDGIGFTVPVDTRNNFACKKVDKVNVAAKLSVPVTVGAMGISGKWLKILLEWYVPINGAIFMMSLLKLFGLMVWSDYE